MSTENNTESSIFKIRFVPGDLTPCKLGIDLFLRFFPLWYSGNEVIP